MRVVLLDRDSAVRAKMRAAIDSDAAFVLVGESHEWSDCQALVDRFVPELVLARINQLPCQFVESLSDADFPVLVGLRSESNGVTTLDGLYDTLRVPLEPEHLRGLLARVRREIYRRQADELSLLVERYVACTAKGGPQYLSKLQVEEEGQTKEIPVERVLLIAADGNYVRIHADSRTYEIWDTLSGTAVKMDPSRFARIHRSFIVNLSHVLNTATKDIPSVVKLNNGMEVPIGPNYREELEYLPPYFEPHQHANKYYNASISTTRTPLPFPLSRCSVISAICADFSRKLLS
jgi:two-component system LytT family response regulator